MEPKKEPGQDEPLSTKGIELSGGRYVAIHIFKDTVTLFWERPLTEVGKKRWAGKTGVQFSDFGLNATINDDETVTLSVRISLEAAYATWTMLPRVLGDKVIGSIITRTVKSPPDTDASC